MRDCFDVVGLREHVEGGEGVEGVACGDECAEVACEGGGVAGDVGDARGVESEDACESFGVCARAGWVEEEEVNGRETSCVLCEPCADVRRFDLGVGESGIGEIEAREGGGRRVAFDARDARKATRERQREQADAAIEINCGRAAHFVICVFERVVEERFEERVVDLKKAGRVEAITLAREHAKTFAGVS